MTYTFPPSLDQLRKFLKSKGFSGDSVKTSRQAAFIAQQLLGSKQKFPPKGEDMLPTLLAIQGAMPDLLAKAAGEPRKKSKLQPQAKIQREKDERRARQFAPETFAAGVHIFCDGAAIPNPGAGGWGVAIYQDGVEIGSAYGGAAEATNNQMELTAILNAAEAAARLPHPEQVTIWCDSQYCVKGCNEWRHGWKANGWSRKGPNATKPETGVLANADLWKAIDAALDQAAGAAPLIKWVKGHFGVAGNERADGLADMGRKEAEDASRAPLHDDLDQRYRQIMGAM